MSNIYNSCVIVWGSLLLLISLIATVNTAIAQSDEIDINVILDSRFQNAQSISISDLNISSTGSGARLMDVQIINLAGRTLENLYFHISVESSNYGTIVTLDQEQGSSFSLRANTPVRFNNNSMQRGIPGIDDRINLNGGLTSDGERLFNRLEGSGRLPSGIYTIDFSIYKGGNGSNGGRLVAQSLEQFEVGRGGDDRDILLMAPGGPIGEDEFIPVRRPFFSWTGGGSDRYRVIVVHADTDSPESLLSQAYQSDVNDRLDFKMLDEKLRSTELNYPSAGRGAQELQYGETYYWQVFAEIDEPGGVSVNTSEIWEFTVGSSSGVSSGSDMMDQLLVQLRSVLTEDEINMLIQGNYELGSITHNGRTYRQPQAVTELLQLINRIQAGEIEIIE